MTASESRHRPAVLALIATLLLGCENKTVESPPLPEKGLSASSSNAITNSTESEKDPSIRKPYFGELHVHSANSYDAFTTGVRVSPEDAYRYGRGEAIDHVGGVKIQANQPLDFMAVTDHAEYLGLMPMLVDSKGPLSGTSLAREMLSGDPERFRRAAMKIVTTIGDTPPIVEPELDVPEVSTQIWKSYVTLADRYYEPGVFTTLVGYEWTSSPGGNNLHRNVIFRGTDVPDLPFSSLDSNKPEELWRWLDKARDSGSDVLAIPHNSNLSDGLMFSRRDSWGKPLNADYAETRMRNEPLVEVSQIKGSSETHPVLSADDEWADFELLKELLGNRGIGKVNGSYVREAYLNGLQFQDSQGFNPYKFGLVAASDSHNSSFETEENNYTGKMGHLDGTAKSRLGGSFISSSNLKYSASGLTGVWAASNTREHIFDALKRKETFATSGPRISVKLFAGHFPAKVPATGLSNQILYAQGLPMGSDLPANRPVQLYAWAARDANSAPLQRLQIVKGWVDNGELKEQVFDVACSDGLQPDPNSHRCPDNGATVDIRDCAIPEEHGAAQLAAVWNDPDFDANQHAFYYVRALENPTCRWSTWDALRNGWEPPSSVPATLQERAWSSPVWYSPAG